MVYNFQNINKYVMRITEIDSEPVRIKLKGFGGPKKAKTKAASFIDKMYSTFQINPMNDSQIVMMFDNNGEQQLALLTLVRDINDPDTVYIDWIQTHPQRQGVGKKALNKLQELANNYGVSLKLVSWKKGDIPAKTLDKFYKSVGFTSSPDTDELTWKPRAVSEMARKTPWDKMVTGLRGSGIDLNKRALDADKAKENLAMLGKKYADIVSQRVKDGKIPLSPEENARIIAQHRKSKIDEAPAQPTPTTEELAIKWNRPMHSILSELKIGMAIETKNNSDISIARRAVLANLANDLYFYH
jgi:hypothetical protein